MEDSAFTVQRYLVTGHEDVADFTAVLAIPDRKPQPGKPRSVPHRSYVGRVTVSGRAKIRKVMSNL